MVKLETGEEGSAVRLDAAQPDVSMKPSVADREQMLSIFCLMFGSRRTGGNEPLRLVQRGLPAELHVCTRSTLQPADI